MADPTDDDAFPLRTEHLQAVKCMVHNCDFHGVAAVFHPDDGEQAALFIAQRGNPRPVAMGLSYKDLRTLRNAIDKLLGDKRARDANAN